MGRRWVAWQVAGAVDHQQIMQDWTMALRALFTNVTNTDAWAMTFSGCTVSPQLPCFTF